MDVMNSLKRAYEIEIEEIKHQEKPRRVFSVLNEDHLIDAVHARPSLYDRSLKTYRKPTARQHAWQEVADTMQCSITECKRRWRSLRDGFLKQYKLCQNDGSQRSESKKKKWLHYQQMEFLANYLSVKDGDDDPAPIYITDGKEMKIELSVTTKSDQDIDSYEEVDETDANYTVYDENGDIVFTESIGTNIDTATMATTSSLIESDVPIEIADDPVDILPDNGDPNRSPNQNNSYTDGGSSTGTTDPDERFLLSCAPILKRLSDRKNCLARIKIQQILYELEFDESN